VEAKKTIFILGIIIITSGCVDEIQNNDSQSQEMPNKGLEIEEFSITDDELRPEQNALMTARFKNYHTDIDIQTLEVFNEGAHLNVDKEGCNPSIDELSGAREDLYPEMECTWTVEAPEEEALRGFSERREPLKLRVEYEGSIENQEPLQVEFRDVGDIEHTSTESLSFSNDELSVDMIAESPITHSGNSIELKVDDAGPGRVEGDYSFEYTPEGVFEDCDDEGEQVIDSEWSTVCTLSAESSGAQNLFFTTHYKYIKEPNLDITLVNRR